MNRTNKNNIYYDQYKRYLHKYLQCRIIQGGGNASNANNINKLEHIDCLNILTKDSRELIESLNSIYDDIQLDLDYDVPTNIINKIKG